MKLLFDKSDESGAELHDILGFVDAGFSMTQILPYIRKSTRELIKWIGENNYEKAIELYENGDSEDEFLIFVRYAISLGAFREFMPLSDISFTTSGRQFRADDHMKAPWEWQIDKSDEALERSYYASLDEVICHIIENYEEPLLIEISEEEGSAEAEEIKFDLPPRIKTIKELCVSSLDVFQDSVKINDSYLLFFNLVPSLKLAENQLLKTRTGAKFEEYKENTQSHIRELMQTICVYFAMADGLKKNSVQLFPKSVFQENKNGRNSAKRLDIEATVLYYNEQNKILLADLEKAVAKDKNRPITGSLINFGCDDAFVTM
ncbi:hypothetical protein [Chryseobacterium sp. FH1]|uniref:DUF6712 family protein n=1 Tax=Chryseobacterium sp. FH1 TaxID=1233951 RepID=UPI0004E333DF|nr:hypothetical protein [Chryseobacterium sp. FH1]KFC19370.1 hypothetical protein IO90_08690 [Chryseobacterium sp. FH1]